MKIVLNPSEVNEIIVEYLISQGKIEDEDTDITWYVDNYRLRNSVIVVEQ
jgi:hypothetical protein